MKKRGKILSFMILLLIFTAFTGCKAKTIESGQITETAERTISTKELSEKLGSPEFVVVDVRSEAQYNGWKLEGEVRGGHIRGAVDFPLSWTNDLKKEDLKDLLESKGITADKTVVLYDTLGDKSPAMAEILKGLGYENILVYEAGMMEWAGNDTLPMDKLANYEKLVYPEWINALIKGENPDTYPGKGYKIFEVSWGEGKEYKEGHIPGAVHLDTNELEEEPLWNRVSDKDIEKMLLRNGITYDTTVVLYGSDTTAAARAASIMMYAGVEDVRILNGGFGAWTEAGLDIETEVQSPVPVEAFGIAVPAHPEYIIDTKEAKEILADENAELASVRSWEEYIGETSGYTYIKPKGRIAGATWAHAGSDPYHMEDYRNVNNTMRNYHEIAKNWEDWDITSDKKVAFFCGTGWRASEAFFDAYLMGWDKIAVYDGGWYEWSMDEANPVETGEPK
ncbi:thiosulfate sulfurtransferase [Crassaminicella thermophila]|uniref:thiosulfate sulfurtransferase n=1 Tax=Crassaminicella thermophila TaxID=2599308 RepID=A0A5C0SI92_CRATE|nr:rhodanese-like domain-containing protein [Crassaminicella thermophila]QEK12918.1 thiosulfate sulfurtransferase [Crassaminicella thermophila]